jgi:predicted DNA-binding antitoxin AbrB/MazE fold protein
VVVAARQIEAIYSNGVFHPLEPLTLNEGQRVQMTVHVSTESTEPMNDRREEMAWLANESGPYAGLWVALDGGRLVAHGSRLAEVSTAARAAGVDKPFYSRVPVADDLS